MNYNFQRNVNSNSNGIDKINSISENPTKIKVSFYRVSDVPHQKLRVRLCTQISEKNLGVRLLEHMC